MPTGTEAQKVYNSLSSPELHALEGVDDLESIIGRDHAEAIKHMAKTKKN